MTMDLNPVVHEDESINVFFEGMSVFRSRWNVLNERCKKLEASLQEARIEKEQLRAKLALSRDYTQKIEKEKDELAIVVQELHKDLQQNSLLKWIETLGEKISVLNNTVPKLPKVNRNDVSQVIDDITLLSSDDENDSLPNDDEETHEIRRKESCTIRDRPNSTCSDLTDHVYPLANSTTLQTTASAGSEVSVVDTTMSIENSPRRESSENQSLSDTPAIHNDEISHVDVPTSSHNSPLIVPLVEKDVPSADIEELAINGEISKNEPPLSQQLTASVDEESLSSTHREQLSFRKEIITCSNDEVDEIQSITTSEKLPPPTVKESEIEKLTSSRTSPQITVEETESTSDKCENTNNIANSKTGVNSPDPPQLISVTNVLTSTNGKKSTDSANDSEPSSASLREYSSDDIPVTNNGNRVETSMEITKSNRDVTGDVQQAAESYRGHFLDLRSEMSNKNGIDIHVPLSNQHVQFTSEALLQQGVNHEEILPAEETPSENVPDTESSDEPGDSDTFEITNHESEIVMNCENSTTCEITNHRSDVINGEEKSTIPGVTPEELISQIFGSPMTSPNHDPDVICISNVPNCTIDLNMSDEESIDTGKPSASIVQPELTVNLPRIFIPVVKVTEESVNTVTSYLTNESKFTENGQSELSNSKRSRSPSPSVLEPKAKRSSPCKSIELDDNVSPEKKIMKCSFCKSDEEFDCYSALDAHIIAQHPNPYPYYFRCRYGRGNCRRHFRTTKKVNDHVRRRHFGEDLSLPVEKLYPGQKPWKCSICDKIFAHSSHLRGHLRHIHNVTETEGIAKYEFKMHVRKVKRRTVMKSQKNGCSVGQCVICLNDEGSSEKFKTYQDLDEHIFKNHENPYPFYLRCPFCKNENVRHFKGLSWLNNHIENNHWSKVSSRSNN